MLEENGSLITRDILKKCLPAKMRQGISNEVVDSIVTKLSDPTMSDIFEENFISYLSVLKEGKFRMDNYINAVKYVTHKSNGDTNLEAYMKTFPKKYTDFKARGVSDKDIASYYTAYNKSKLVFLIYERSLMPTHVMNAHVFQKAINVQAELMMNANSEKVRSDAANSLLTHLKPPENKEISLNIGIEESSVITSLRESTQALVAQQKEAIMSGSRDVLQIAEDSLIIDTSLEEN